MNTVGNIQWSNGWRQRKCFRIVFEQDKVQNETKNHVPIAKIANFENNKGNDTMKTDINENYSRIKKEVFQIIAIELERIGNDPELKHLIKK